MLLRMIDLDCDYMSIGFTYWRETLDPTGVYWAEDKGKILSETLFSRLYNLVVF